MGKKLSITILTIVSILLILGIVFACVPLQNGELGKYDYNNFPSQIKLGLDLKGGVYAVFGVKESELSDKLKENDEDLNNALKGTANSLESLLFSKGYTEAVVTMSGTGKNTTIRVEVPNVDDPETIFQLIGRPQSLHFKKTENDDFTSNDVILDGSNVENAGVTQDQNGAWAVSLKFDSEGAKKFADATSAMQGKPIHIYVGRQLKTSPTVQAVITNGEAIITGNYDYDSAYELAVAIQSGSFDVPLFKRESSTISPTLGKDAIKSGLIAGGVGILFIIVFLSCIYGLLGVAASISLIWYTLTYLFFLSIFPWVQLTLPGIAGILLSIGMAVDANVIIFERIKEEYKMSAGQKSMQTCVKNGFRRSLSAIIDGNVTTVIGAIVLMFIATASIKGFAITLLIGILISLISSLLVTSLITKCIMVFDKNPKHYRLRRATQEELDNSPMIAESSDEVQEGGNA